MKKVISLSFLLICCFTFAQKKWTLKECVDYAVQNNLTVNQNRIQEELQQNDLQKANNQWLPTLSGYLNNSLTLGSNYPLLDKPYQQYSNNLGINSNITIYQGGLVNLNKERASLSIQSGQLHTEDIINEISLLVVNYYLNIMLNRELLEISQGNLDVSIQQLERTQKLFENDRVSRAELVQAEANAAQEHKNVADAKIEVERALFNLSVLLQLPDYREFDVEIIEIPNEIYFGLYDLNEILTTAYTQQPSIKKAEIDLKASEKDIEIAKTGLKPTISGSFNFGTNYSDFFNKGLVSDALLSQWYDNLTSVFGVNVSIPIFEKHTTKLNVEKAKINQSLAQNFMEQEKQKLRQNIQEAYFNAHSSYQAYEAAKESVKSNELSADFAQKSFEAGVLNLYDLNIANNNLVIAKSQMAQAKYNFIFRMKVLDFYAGLPLTEGLE